MKRRATFATVVVVSMLYGVAYAQSTKSIRHTYSDVRLIILNASGDCKLAKSPDSKLTVELAYSYPDDEIIYSFEQAGDSLFVRQKYHAPSVRNDGRWTITVPDHSQVRIILGNGSVIMSQLNVDAEAETASGDITVAQASGTFRLSTSKGSIDIADTHFSGQSSFASSKGDIRVTMPSKLIFDLTLKAGSGNIQLRLNQNPFEGTIIATANKKHGKIQIPFLNPVVTEQPENRDILVQKTYYVGSAKPMVKLSSGNGLIIIKKQ